MYANNRTSLKGQIDSIGAKRLDKELDGFGIARPILPAISLDQRWSPPASVIPMATEASVRSNSKGARQTPIAM